MPPVSRAVMKTTSVRTISGHTTEGAWRNLIFRLSAYCSMAMVKLTAANAIHTCGRPGTKNNMAEVFQVAISQRWCQRNNSGMASTAKMTATTPRVLKFSGSGVASM